MISLYGGAVVIAFGLYFSAHFLRALKYWLIKSESHLSLGTCFLIFYGTAALGFFIPLFVTELIRLVLLCYTSRTISKSLVSYALFRLQDVLFLGIASIFFPSKNLPTLLGVNVAIFITGLSVLMFVTLMTAAQTFIPIQEILLRRLKNAVGIAALEITAGITNACSELNGQLNRVFVVPFLLTILIWTLDCLALHQLLGDRSIADVASSWISFSFMSLVSPAAAHAELANLGKVQGGLPMSLFYPQIFALVLLFAFKLGATRWRLKGVFSRVR